MLMPEDKKHVTGKWSPQEIEMLKELYSHKSNEELSEKLKRPVSAIRSKAYKLRLKKAVDRVI
jgi:DNA-binding CsgD family transcriptional regulator